MLRDRETLTWAILWLSFVTFSVFCAGGLLAARWYLLSATDPQQATLRVVVGTVLVREEGRPDWVFASPEIPLKEGMAIRTEHNSQALVAFFDESTITLLPDTEIVFSSLRLSRFLLLTPLKAQIGLAQRTGKVVVGVAPPFAGSTRFEVGVLQGFLTLTEGSYTLDLTGYRARVRVKEGGRATVTAQGKTVEAGSGQRIDLYPGEPPRSPGSATIELLANGDFAEGLKRWNADNIPGFSEGADLLGTVQTVQGGGAPSVRFLRAGSKDTHNETRLTQYLDEDVSFFTKVQLSIEFRLLKQSLSGGGYMGSEYPLLVRVHYRSDQGDTYAFRGFYYQNEANNRTDNGTAVPFNTWYQWTMPENLMTLSPIPRRITGIEIGASGWDYQSEIRRVSLTGE